MSDLGNQNFTGKIKKEKDTEKCVICSSHANLTCANCNSVKYCSKEHQTIHLKIHKDTCRPYAIKYNEVLGRHLTASRCIKQGELILKESPAAIGPQIQTSLLCLNCYKPIPVAQKIFFCSKCNKAPLCSLTCSANGHNLDECVMFQTNKKLTSANLVQHFQIIMPLRCLLLKDTNPYIWKELLHLESHIEERRNTSIWRNHKTNVEDILLQCGIITEDDIKQEIVQKICGILDVNTFELRTPDLGLDATPRFEDRIRGLYLQAAIMAHDCIGNTHLAVDDEYSLIVRASIPIAEGEKIYFNYTNTLQGTCKRTEHLKEGKYFICTCIRCNDVTECGTYMSSLICVKCYKGLITPNNPTEEKYASKTIWRCSEKKCQHKCIGSLIGLAVNESERLSESLDRCSIPAIENMIKKLLLSLSPNHWLILDLKQCLIAALTEILRQEINFNKNLFQKKLQLCKEVFSVVECVEPGISRLKGIILYDMHIPMVVLANGEYDNGEISVEQFLKKLLDGEETLKNALTFLLYEPKNSPEGRLAVNAMKELILLRNSINSVKKLVKKTDKRSNAPQK